MLLNELYCSPGATLDALLKMLSCSEPMLRCKIRAAEAPFIAFMISLAVDVLSYVVHVIEQLRDEARSCDQPPMLASSGAPLLPLLQDYATKLENILHGPFKCMCICMYIQEYIYIYKKRVP